MKKNILIIILGITTIFFLIYAFIKADEATKAAMEAQMERDEAVLLLKQAEELKAEAERQAEKSRRLRAIANELRAALEECKAK